MSATATATATASKPAASAEPNNPLGAMNKLQKLAALLVVLGPDLASELLGGFEQKEVEEISTEMIKIGFVPIATQKALLKEFSQLTLEAVTSVSGGPNVARMVMEKSLGGSKASEAINRLV